MRRPACTIVAAALAAAAVAVTVAVLARDETPPPLPLPAAPAPAFAIPTPTLLSEPRPAARWTTVLRPVRARTTSAAADGPLLTTQTEEGTANVVAVLGTAEAADGQLWVKIRMPGLPGRTTGWVPRDALGIYQAVRTRLVVDLEWQSAVLLRDGRPVFRAAVGIGRPGWDTPRGEFYVRSRLTAFQSAFYGPVAFATSARSPAATDWPGGGVVGIHGTNRPELLPGRVSHGCIRLRNADIRRLDRLMRVGTPVTIR